MGKDAHVNEDAMELNTNTYIKNESLKSEFTE